MIVRREKILLLFIFFGLAGAAWAQSGVRPKATPTPESDEKITTEEIKLNVLALDNEGDFASGLKPEDLVIVEDNRIQQASSVRRIPANVLFLLDVGGEITYAKRNKITAQTARGLVGALSENDSVAVMQYADKTSVLSDWTKNKAQLTSVLGDMKLGFGKRSNFNEALSRAVEYFAVSPTENRHLVIISDGVDSSNNESQKAAAVKNILSSDINVHVISYTKLQQIAMNVKVPPSTGGANSNALPPGASAPHSNDTQRVPLLTINLDREMVRKRKEQAAKLKTSEEFLTTLAEDTNGDIFLPDTTDEMIEKTGTLAKTIDSQYVVTYVPKRPLDESRDGETRLIEVSSRRPGVEVQGKRKFVVTNK